MSLFVSTNRTFFTTCFKLPLIRLFFIFLLFVCIISLYWPGIYGGFFYDDLRPLGALSHIKDLQSALVYIFSGTAGPLGRPISLFSFAIQHNDWPNNPPVFFSFNAYLHALNGLVIFGISYLISELYQGQNNSNFWLAFATTALWLVLPIHVSTSFIAIQRMTGLSAFFVFFGIFLYLLGLRHQSLSAIDKRPKITHITLQLVGLVLCSLLAIFSKENGILLPVLVLILEVTLLRKITTIAVWRNKRIVAGALVLIVIVLYIAFLAIKTGNNLPTRSFSTFERLLTQPQILLEYLRLAYFPVVSAINPFHDNYQAVKTFFSYQAFFSLFVVLGTIVTAFYYRLKYPLFSFAVFWFFGAHILESTSIPLELYFQHRNYVALFGPCFSFVLAINKVCFRYKKLVYSVSLLYWLSLAFSLHQTTKIWGTPKYAAHVWFEQQKGSVRAAEYLAKIYYEDKKLAKAKTVIEQQLIHCPDCIYSRVQAIFLSCLIQDKEATIYHYDKALLLAQSEQKIFSAPGALAMLYQANINNTCKLLSLEQLTQLNLAVVSKKSLKSGHKRRLWENLYQIANTNHQTELAQHYLQLAWKNSFSHKVAQQLIDNWLINKKHNEALFFAKHEMCKRLSNNPLLRKPALTRCQNAVDEIKDTLTTEAINNE